MDKIYLNYCIKCFHDEQIKEAKLDVIKTFDSVIIKFVLDELEIVKKTDNYFIALLEVRKELEPLGIKLLCKGCCRNVYPSSMSMDMGSGMIAYAREIGREVKSEDSVRIFDDCTLEEYATIEEQLLFYKKWYESILHVRNVK